MNMAERGRGEFVASVKRAHTCVVPREFLNPLARGFLILPDANFSFRQSCAPLRYIRSASVSYLLTAPQRSETQPVHNDSDQHVLVPRKLPAPTIDEFALRNQAQCRHRVPMVVRAQHSEG